MSYTKDLSNIYFLNGRNIQQSLTAVNGSLDPIPSFDAVSAAYAEFTEFKTAADDKTHTLSVDLASLSGSIDAAKFAVIDKAAFSYDKNTHKIALTLADKTDVSATAEIDADDFLANRIFERIEVKDQALIFYYKDTESSESYKSISVDLKTLAQVYVGGDGIDVGLNSMSHLEISANGSIARQTSVAAVSADVTTLSADLTRIVDQTVKQLKFVGEISALAAPSPLSAYIKNVFLPNENCIQNGAYFNVMDDITTTDGVQLEKNDKLVFHAHDGSEFVYAEDFRENDTFFITRSNLTKRFAVDSFAKLSGGNEISGDNTLLGKTTAVELSAASISSTSVDAGSIAASTATIATTTFDADSVKTTASLSVDGDTAVKSLTATSFYTSGSISCEKDIAVNGTADLSDVNVAGQLSVADGIVGKSLSVDALTVADSLLNVEVGENKGVIVNLSSNPTSMVKIYNGNNSKILLKVTDEYGVEMANGQHKFKTDIAKIFDKTVVVNDKKVVFGSDTKISATMLSIDFSKTYESATLKTLKSYLTDLSDGISAVESRIGDVFVKNYADAVLSDGIETKLSVIKTTGAAYDTGLTDPTLSDIYSSESAIYIIDRDYIEAYGQQIKNLTMADDVDVLSVADVAATKHYVDVMLSTTSDELTGIVDAVSAQIQSKIIETSAALSSPIFVANVFETDLSDGTYRSDLSVVRLSSEDYYALVCGEGNKFGIGEVGHMSADPTTIYVVDDDYVNAYGREIKYVLSSNEISSAATVGYVNAKIDPVMAVLTNIYSAVSSLDETSTQEQLYTAVNAMKQGLSSLV